MRPLLLLVASFAFLLSGPQVASAAQSVAHAPGRTVAAPDAARHPAVPASTQVTMVRSAALGSAETLHSPRYTLTVQAQPGWMITVTPERDAMSVPATRVSLRTPHPSVAAQLLAVSRFLGEPLPGGGRRPSLAQRLCWEDRVCPG